MTDKSRSSVNDIGKPFKKMDHKITIIFYMCPKRNILFTLGTLNLLAY